MNKHIVLTKRILSFFLVGVLGTFVFAAPHVVSAQNTAEKIQLMAEALRARDSGDLSSAKAKAEALIAIAPDDENARRLLASINKEINSQDEDKDDESAVKASSVDSAIAAAVADQNAKIRSARAAIPQAMKFAEMDAHDEGIKLLESVSAPLMLNTTTRPVLEKIEQTRSEILSMKAAKEEKAESIVSIEEISPDYVSQSKIIDELLVRGRAQYLNGDYDGAISTFKEVEARDANNAEAKLFQTRIAKILGDIHVQNLYKTREQMLTEVDQSWERPKVFNVDKEVNIGTARESGILQQMKNIVIPQVNFSGMELTRVLDTLSELSVEYDPAGVGVNIVPLFDPNQNNPRVNISLRNLNLDLVLEFITKQVNFSYDVGGDVVTVDFTDAPGGESSNLTEFFPISRATIIRLIGIPEENARPGARDPFADPVSSPSSNSSNDTDKLKTFFQSAGVNFDLPGADLAFDGEQLIVTQTPRNLERMRIILRNYNEIKQVEIEAKFLEVSQSDLDELGFSWFVGGSGDTISSFSNPRDLSSAFAQDAASSSIRIDDGISPPDIITSGAPGLTNAIDLGLDGLSQTFVSSVLRGIGGYDVDVVLRALSRKSGSDLMSAPKVTVLSGKRATITVAQELIYPESYGDIEAEVASGEGLNNDGAGIAITAGTPQDFVSRNIGVEMSVTPNVENDDTISLILEPKVTEFEGFVEYGGNSVAIQGNTNVVIPSGFFQPIFSTRSITTEVSVFDGATVVMGGLTRDEIKTIKDKVPVLGDIPGIGRLFRSEGETRLKRNLLIFVTANLVSPGGSPANQSYRNVNANSLFQNPTIMTPSGTVNRSIEASDSQ